MNILELVTALQNHKFDTNLELHFFEMRDRFDVVDKYGVSFESGTRKFQGNNIADCIAECITEIQNNLTNLKDTKYAHVKAYIYAPYKITDKTVLNSTNLNTITYNLLQRGKCIWPFDIPSNTV